jgi:hypothetical protein
MFRGGSARVQRNRLFEIVDWIGGANEDYPLFDLQPPGPKKASKAVPKLAHNVDQPKPKLSSSDDKEKKESDGW